MRIASEDFSLLTGGERCLKCWRRSGLFVKKIDRYGAGVIA